MATATKTHTFPTRVTIPAKSRAAVINLLNQQLADTLDLYSQAKQAHWNVKGSHFIGLHKLFDEIAENIEPAIDEIAERVTALGGTAFGTARMAASASRLPEYPDDIAEGHEHLEAIADRLGNYAATVREAIDTAEEVGDKDTSDLLIDVSRIVDKYLWFVEAHLQA